MHVVIFVDFPDATMGGTQTSVRAQRKALEAAGHTVTMVTPPTKNGPNDDPDTIFVSNVPFSPYEFPLVLPTRRLERRIEAELAKRPLIDVIHVQSDTGVGVMGVRIARRLKKPLIQTLHTREDVFMQKTMRFPLAVTFPAYFFHKLALGAPPTKVHRLDESYSEYCSWRVMVHHVQQANVVTVPSHHFAERLRAHGLTKAIEVVPNGLDDALLEQIWGDLPSAPAKTTLPIRAAWVARLSPEKRPLLAIEAVKDLADITLDFYGEGTDEAAMKRYISKHDLGDRVKLRGRLSQAEVIREVARHDIFIQSSFGFDTQSIVLLESTAAGVPSVISDPDLTGSVVPKGHVLTKTPDVQGLKDGLAGLVAHPEKVDAMKSVVWENRASVAQSKVREKMLVVYDKAMQSASGRSH